jgi:hypothetical protein
VSPARQTTTSAPRGRTLPDVKAPDYSRMHSRGTAPRRSTGVRRDYVLDPREFDALHGHDPDDMGCLVDPKPTRGWPSPVYDQPMQEQGGVYLHRCPQGFGTVDDDPVPTWAKVADRLGVHMLTIHWPDQHYPEFTAVPR